MAQRAAQLRNQLAALTREIALLEVAPVGAGRRRRRQRQRQRRRANGRPQPAIANVPAGNSSVPQPIVMPGQRRRRRRGGQAASASVNNGGRILLSRDELLVVVSAQTKGNETIGSLVMAPSTDAMSFLNQLSKCYQRIRWIRCSVTWRPGVGTTTNGVITYGFAFNNQSVTTRSKIAALTPVNDHPVWQTSQAGPLVVPTEMLMTRKWYALNSTATDFYDRGLGTFYYGVSHDTLTAAQTRGEFWVSYSVEMEGTNES